MGETVTAVTASGTLERRGEGSLEAGSMLEANNGAIIGPCEIGTSCLEG